MKSAKIFFLARFMRTPIESGCHVTYEIKKCQPVFPGTCQETMRF
jgi:hypothetical protein